MVLRKWLIAVLEILDLVPIQSSRSETLDLAPKRIRSPDFILRRGVECKDSSRGITPACVMLGISPPRTNREDSATKGAKGLKLVGAISEKTSRGYA